MDKYKKYIKELKSICLLKQFDYKAFKLTNGCDFLIVEITPEKYEKTLLIIAGLHGNEQSPVYAVKEFLSEYSVSKERLIIFPSMNPWGLVNNSRKNANEFDLNRIKNNKPIQEEQVVFFKNLVNTKIDACLSLHEDSATRKSYFYAYNKEFDSEYRRIQGEVGKFIDLNLNNKIDGNMADRGVIYDKNDSSLENYMFLRGVPMVLCSETGGREDMGFRIKSSLEIIKSMVSTVSSYTKPELY